MKLHQIGSSVLASILVLGSGFGADNFPEVILLPTGWGPEGIASGRGTEFYAGARHQSPFAGAIYKGDFRTGQGQILVPAQSGRAALGLKFDPRSDLLFVAGGPTGAGYVYDASTGQDVAVFQFATAGFVNDVVVTRTAAYFTDSANPVLYVVPLGPGGEVLDPNNFEVLPLSGDFAQIPNETNANGIVATPNGNALIVVQSNTGLLFRVDPATGVTSVIDLGGESVSRGDGLLLQGHTLFVVRNSLNQIAVIELDNSLPTGEYVGNLADSDFNIPTTIARFGNSLYAVNAKFGAPFVGTNYEVVRVAK